MKNFLRELQRRALDPTLSEEYRWEIRNFFDYQKNYWNLYDIDNGTIHEKIFESLYIKERKNSYDQISERFFISERTLDRYVIRYNRFAWAVIERKYPEKSAIFKMSSEIMGKIKEKSAKKWR